MIHNAPADTILVNKNVMRESGVREVLIYCRVGVWNLFFRSDRKPSRITKEILKVIEEYASSQMEFLKALRKRLFH